MTAAQNREHSDGPASESPPGAGGSARTKQISSYITKAPPWTGVGVLTMIIVVGMALLSDVFFTYTNLNNILRGAAAPLLLGIGTTFVITTGMIDLSMGSLLALTSMMVLGFMNIGLPVPLAVLAAIAAATLLGGGINGLLIAKSKLFFLVVTLGTMAIFRSAAQLPTQGNSITLAGRDGFGFVQWVGDGKVGPISVPVFLAITLLLLSAAVMRYTNFGRSVNAVGGNESAARLAGIAVDRVRISVFAINGFFVGVAGVVVSGRLSTASPSVGQGVELQVIAAVLLGGSSFMGGSSTLVGTFIGVLFTAVLQNALNLMEVQVFWQGIVTGVVLIAAVAIDRVRTTRA